MSLEALDHGHVLSDLRDRYDAVLEAIEATDGWITNRLVPYKIILGALGDIEAGVRQLIRARPLEVVEVELPSGRKLRVPTLEEILRIKGYLLATRNQTRDYLDVAALTETLGLTDTAMVISRLVEFYEDQHGGGRGVASQLVRQLSEPRPRDSCTTLELSHYKQLDPRWHDWQLVVGQCQALADAVLERLEAKPHGDAQAALKFRNISADPTQPVETWPTEGMIAALERGDVGDWARVSAAVRNDPWGPVARRLEDALATIQPYGVGPLMQRVLVKARQTAEASEREEVARRVCELVQTSGLDRASFAQAIGTSASRLSTYATGKVMPSAALLVRMERVADRAVSRPGRCS